MDELQYRDTYHRVNAQRCHFEKAINARVNTCRHMRRFNLADREGVSCTEAEAGRQCATWLTRLRHAARFALATDSPQALPHRLEAKVQSGGLQGLATLLNQAPTSPDIADLLDTGVQQFDTLEDIPLTEVIDAVVHYEPRRRKSASDP